LNPEQQKPNKLLFCKKVVYGNPAKPTIILGIVESEDPFFLNFRTRRGSYQINKSQIITIEETKEVYEERL